MDMVNTQRRAPADPEDRAGGRVAPARETLRQKTLVKLREAIACGQLRPNHRLVERDVCAQTGVSRSSVREALRYLEAEGLVESRGTRGMFVVMPTVEEAREIHELRLAVESAAADQFVARATDAEIQTLIAVFESLKTAAASDLDAYWRLTDRWFDVMMRGARNQVACGLMTTLRTRIRCLRAAANHEASSDRRRESIEAMGQLTAALARRDGSAATETLRGLIERSASVMEAQLRAL